MTQAQNYPAPRNGYNANTKAWGGEFWRVAHSITFQYSAVSPSVEEKQTIRLFFDLFPKLLPCWRCGNHFEEMLREHPLTDQVLTNRETLSRWLHMLHNKVNVRIGKPTVKYEDVVMFYLADRNVGLPRTPLYPTSSTSPLGGCSTCVAVAALLAALGIGIGVGVAIRSRRK